MLRPNSPDFYTKTLPALKDVLLPDTGAIYLPYCGNCFRNLVAAEIVLEDIYKIEMMREGDLDEISLFKHTNDIDKKVMQVRRTDLRRADLNYMYFELFFTVN